jgi:serine/threonine protein kinase
VSKPAFGKFQIVGQLARGGMADIFLCRLQGIGGFDKEVVVKCILPERAADPDFVTMFLDEARVAANLNHPGIVQVFEIGEEGGVPYMAMEYVRGVTLQMVVREMHRQKKMHYGHCAKIISGVCEALDYAHNAVNADGDRLDLVHRDVSPANIVLSREGVPKLLDFGVAKANKRLSETQAGTLKGKLRYMAPEQISQEPIDHRADVFSLGVCLFELTTFRHPFAPAGGSEASLFKNVIQGLATKPSDLVAAYPPALEKIVLAAIERDVGARIPSAREMHNRLEAFTASGPYASSSREVAAFLRELFPDFGNLTKTTGNLPVYSGATPGGGRAFPATGAGSSGARRATHSSPILPLTGLDVDGLGGETPASAWQGLHEISASGPPPSRSSWWKWALTLGAGLGTAGAVSWYFRPHSPPVAPPVHGPEAVQNDDATAKRFMDEAERLVGEKRFDPALEILTKASTLHIQSADLNIRLARLRDSVATEALLRRASNHLKQREWAEAIDAAKGALDRDPDNAEAPRIIASARAALMPRTAAPSAPPSSGKSREVRREGTLAITTNPPAMVYVDDEPIGRAPLTRTLSVGAHKVQVRTHGYRPGQADIKVSPGQTVALVLPLVSDTATSPPPRPAPTAASSPSEDDDDRRPSSQPSGRPAASVTPPPVENPHPAPLVPEEPRHAPSITGVDPFGPPPGGNHPLGPATAPTPSAAPRTTSGPVVSTMPRSPIPRPTLPRVVAITDAEQAAKVCQMVELLVVSRAGVSSQFARGITASLRRQLGTGKKISPVAMYYFIVREAALRHDSVAASNNLSAAQADGSLLKLKDLPAVERDL